MVKWNILIVVGRREEGFYSWKSDLSAATRERLRIRMQMFGTINLETAPVNPELLYLVVQTGFCFPSIPLVESETCCLRLPP